MDIPETRERDSRAALIGGVPSTPMPVPETSPAASAAGAMGLGCWLSRFLFSEAPDGGFGDKGETFAEVTPL